MNEGDKNENVITKKFSDEGIVTSNYASTGKLIAAFLIQWKLEIRNSKIRNKIPYLTKVTFLRENHFSFFSPER